MARDPYKYFRVEAREILEGLTQGTLELENEGATPDRVSRLLRLAHTLKGAARVVKAAAMADGAHRIEDVLAPLRETGGPVAPEQTRAVLQLVDRIAAELTALDAPPAAASPPAPPPAPVAPPVSAAAPPAIVAATPPVASAPPTVTAEAAPTPRVSIADTVRVEISEMDALLEGAVESGVRAGGLRPVAASVRELGRQARRLEEDLALAREALRLNGTDVAVLERAREQAGTLSEAARRSHTALLEATERVEREIGDVQDRAARMRLVPAETLFAPLARAVHDAAAVLGRQVAFQASGGEIRLDAHVLAGVREALLHVVRNAVAHGIETPSERAAAGKPPAGRLTLHVEGRTGRAAFVCRDDGRGIDVAAVARVAREKGLVGEAAVDVATASRLVFQPGVTTSATLNEVAGRGVGLDVVRDVARRFRGDARFDSEPGRGTTVEILVPISLASIAALAVDIGGSTVWVPLEAVARTQRLEAGDLARAAETITISHGSERVRFVPLAGLLPDGAVDAAPSAGAGTAVLVRSGRDTVALGVDRLRGVRSIVVHPLPALVGAQPIVAGAAFDAEGAPELVLDPGGVVQAVCAFSGAPAAEPPLRAPILVIDDSLTTRMLEQSILEAAGYEVDLAVSAEDGLAKARQRRYGLFLVDVEMPGMNGFEFISTTRADPQLRDIPAILVTSLGSAEDRRRGEEAGAYAHIVKGEFDEGRLRQLIRGLLG